MEYEINNIKYFNLQACIDGNEDKITVSYERITDRIKNGWILDDALFTPHENKPDSELGSQEIKSTGISKQYDLFANTDNKKQDRDHKEDDFELDEELKTSVSPQDIKTNKIFVNNKSYKSQTEACRQLNVKFVTFRARLNRGLTIEQALNLVPVIDGRTKKGLKFTIDGKEYTTHELSKKYSIDSTIITKRLRHGASIRQAIGLEPININLLKSQVKAKKRTPISLEVFGEVYSSYKDLADKFGLKTSTVYQRITKYNHSPEVAVSMRGKNKSVTVAGKTYVSKAEFARSLGLNSALVLSRLNLGHSYEDIAASKNTVKKIPTIEYQGQVFGSINELAIISGVRENVFSRQLKLCRSISDIIQYQEKSTHPGRYNLTVLLKEEKQANKPAIIYFVSGKFNVNNNKMYTIGIILDTVNERLGIENNGYEVIKIRTGTLLECYRLKQQIHHLLKDKIDKTVFIDMMDGNSGIFNLNKKDTEVVVEYLSEM